MTNTAAYLKKYDLEDLHQLAVNTGVTNEKALDKDGLIEEISENLLNDDVIKYAFLYSDDAALSSWEQGALDEEYARNLSLTDVYGLYIMGHAYESLNEEDSFFIIDEVLEKFDTVNTEENREARTAVQRQLNLIRSALHLYGVVEFKQIVHLFKKYYGMDVTIEEVVDLVNRSPYVITINDKNKEFIIDDMTNEQYEIIRNTQQKYKYYEPEFGKFIKFSNPGYIDESAAHESLKKWVSEHLNTDVASDYELYLHVLRMIISGRKREDISGEKKISVIRSSQKQKKINFLK
ncbi:hypothetical protein [Jeotgalicoccus sp. WY2]|uniref:hypothetical protein n=1 Tax=Jeotgalicoccus sp. WY2 TaxID=2708346 RepID=UPI001BD4FCF3|nr:hypothetical protein [Jeotgalicoccus sp. WY2]